MVGITEQEIAFNGRKEENKMKLAVLAQALSIEHEKSLKAGSLLMPYVSTLQGSVLLP